MIRISTLVIMVTVLLVAPYSGVAQEPHTLFNLVQQAILKREPKWRIERKQDLNSKYVSMRLKSGKNRISLMVQILRSDNDAAEMFKNWEREISDPSLQTPIEADRIKSSLPILGDENHLWASPSHQVATILFRKKNAFVMVTGSFEKEVKRLALLISDQLDVTQQAVAPDSR